MTEEEAIKLLVNATYADEWQGNEDLTTAHNMSIKALELQNRLKLYTMQDDMHLVTIRQVKQVMEGEWL